MKRINLLLAASILILASCNDYESKFKRPERTDDLVKSKYTSWVLDVKVLTIDSCEYIVAQTGRQDGGVSIIHKQNCKHCANLQK